MYLNCKVKIPNEPGKINRFKRGNTTYIRYVAGRIYHPEKKYNVPDHKTIGKQLEGDPTMMIPNENFRKYFGEIELPELNSDANRSSCIRIGAFLVIRKIMEECDLIPMIKSYLGAALRRDPSPRDR